MTAIAALVLLALGSAYAVRAWIRYLLARQTAQDAAKLAEYRMGHSHRSAACAAPYDQSKATQWQKSQNGKAAYRRAKSRKAQDRVKPATVATPFRKVK